jgi:hypothetical protein
MLSRVYSILNLKFHERNLVYFLPLIFFFHKDIEVKNANRPLLQLTQELKYIEKEYGFKTVICNPGICNWVKDLVVHNYIYSNFEGIKDKLLKKNIEAIIIDKHFDYLFYNTKPYLSFLKFPEKNNFQELKLIGLKKSEIRVFLRVAKK